MTEGELGVEAFWLVIAAGALSGFASWSFFRRWSDPIELRKAINGIVAHLFELRLFAQEPVLVLRAQRDLLTANFYFLRQVITPSLILVLPFAILLVALDSLFGKAPLQLGKPAIVTLELSHSARPKSAEAKLDAPPGIAVETPPVQVLSMSQISWRLRPVRAAKGELRLRYCGRVITKSISSEPGIQWLSGTRAGSVWRFLENPSELPFSSSAIDSVSISYPAASILHVNWLVWFMISSLAGTLAAPFTSLLSGLFQ